MPLTTWATGFYCAAHRDDSGTIHGHTYHARAEWAYDDSCAVERKAQLDAALAEFDHTTLPEALRRAEDMCLRIAVKTGAVRVDVWRDAEGLGATWKA